MPMPQGADYLRSVQNPKLAFADPVLKFSKAERTPQDLPKPYSGGFTTTFKLSGANSAWAVRCFTRPLNDLESRYQAITDFVAQKRTPYFVPTRYVHKGILVNGVWYPVIKMDWVAGEPLNRHIEAHIATPGFSLMMVNTFRRLVSDLTASGVAHGDLQHGNILIQNGALRVIDYDGMYLPSISHYGTSNSGHPNYQHPGRNGSHFSSGIDNFSAIVIYTALLALSKNPSLWKKYNNDENILFRQSDFIDPGKSLLLQDLHSLANPLPLYAERISALCSCNFTDIPSLEEFVLGSQPVISTSPSLYRPRSPYQIFSAADSGAILEHTGQRIEIVGQIQDYFHGMTKFGKPYLFLNMTKSFPNHTFRIVLWSEALQAFGGKIDSLKKHGQWVSVTGVVEVYNQKPQIAVEVHSQIAKLSDESEAKDRLNIAVWTMQAVGAAPAAIVNQKPQIAVEVPSQITQLGDESEAKDELNTAAALTMQVVVAAPAEIITKPVVPVIDPIQDIRSKEAEVFGRLYGGNEPPTSASTAPSMNTPAPSHPQPNVATTTPSHVTMPVPITSSVPSQKPAYSSGFWERLRRFLAGE